MSCPPKLLFSPPNDPYEKKLTCVSKYIDPSSLSSCFHFTIIVCYHEVMGNVIVFPFCSDSAIPDFSYVNLSVPAVEWTVIA